MHFRSKVPKRPLCRIHMNYDSEQKHFILEDEGENIYGREAFCIHRIRQFMDIWALIPNAENTLTDA